MHFLSISITPSSSLPETGRRAHCYHIGVDRPMVVVLGPTGSGKSELGLHLAETYSGEIVNCDSLQLYRQFDIGTAKVPPSERRGIPHHLIDVVEPDSGFNGGEYARLARRLLGEISGRGRLPVVVGGTGFYLRALLEGLVAAPTRDEALRTRLARREARRPGSLHQLLARIDPPAAARIHRNDTNKLIRAVEVCLRARRPQSELYAAERDALRGFAVLKIGLDPPREQLYARLDERARRMFEDGIVKEVRAILAGGVSEEAKPFESLGYRQALDVVRGSCSIEEAIASTQVETRHYAKRQRAWFRREQNVHWLAGFGHCPEIRHLGVELLHGWMRQFR